MARWLRSPASAGRIRIELSSRRSVQPSGSTRPLACEPASSALPIGWTGSHRAGRGSPKCSIRPVLRITQASIRKYQKAFSRCVGAGQAADDTPSIVLSTLAFDLPLKWPPSKIKPKGWLACFILLRGQASPSCNSRVNFFADFPEKPHPDIHQARGPNVRPTSQSLGLIRYIEAEAPMIRAAWIRSQPRCDTNFPQ